MRACVCACVRVCMNEFACVWAFLWLFITLFQLYILFIILSAGIFLHHRLFPPGDSKLLRPFHYPRRSKVMCNNAYYRVPEANIIYGTWSDGVELATALLLCGR